jgi:hypothetical protein
MQYVELPYEVTIQTIDPAYKEASLQAPFPSWIKNRFELLGSAPLAIPGQDKSYAHWYSNKEGLFFGVADKKLGTKRHFVVAEAVSPAVIGPSYDRSFISDWVLFPPHFEEQEEGPSVLGHDFRRIQAEVTMMSTFLKDLSILLSMSVIAQREAEHSFEKSVLFFPDDGRVRGDVLLHLINGKSLYEYSGAEFEFNNYTKIKDFLIFDTLDVSIRSPFLSKLRPYVKWDSKFSIDGVIGAIALLHSILISQPAASTPEKPPIVIIINQSAPFFLDEKFKTTCGAYRADLEKGGVFAIQRYLTALGYKVGKIDGIAGPMTKKGVEKFCHDNNIICSELESSVFSEALVSAMAKKFPIIGYEDNS